MADRKVDDAGNVTLSPRWRSKSVDRMVEEIELLYYKHGKRSYVWVDESWNIDPKFNYEFSQRMIQSKMQFGKILFLD
mgnify:FL=1